MTSDRAPPADPHPGPRAEPLRVGIVGVGKIARLEHLPAIAGTPAFVLAAAASHRGRVDGVENYGSIEAMLAAGQIDAVALCQPPQARYAAARAAIEAGKHVLLEKPPGATLAEVEQLHRLALARKTTLFASWHSRFAAGISPARDWLSTQNVKAVRIVWREDVRQTHAGQDWIFEPGGLGVFDPGVNALSIATAILPPFHLTSAHLTFPANRQAPVKARLHGVLAEGGPIAMDFDFLHVGAFCWDIEVDTDTGVLTLTSGGHVLSIDGVEQNLAPGGEYPRLYARFAELIAVGASDVDIAPLRLVADAFMLAERALAPPFEW